MGHAVSRPSSCADNMKTTGVIISSLMKELGIEDKMKLDTLRDKWTTLFGEPLSLHTYPAELTKGELLVNVDSPAWLQQLKYFRTAVITKLQAYSVTSVKFRHGRIYRKKDPEPPGGNTPAKRRLTEAEKKWIEDTIAEIEDADLREGFRAIMGKALSRKRERR